MEATVKKSPLISLVVPVRDEEASIDRLLTSIAAQTHQPDDIVFVDGGSTDRTVSLIRDALPGNTSYRIIEAGSASPGRGRNIGIAAAANEWIALTDAGIKLDPGWLEELVTVVRREPETDVVYGGFEPVAETFFERNAALVYVPPKQERAGGRMRGPSIASCLLRRKVWDTVGGFPDLRAAEDLIFMERVEQHGFKIAWAPRAIVWWQLRPSLQTTFRRFVLYSRHNVMAGRQQYWHYGIARQYALALVFVLVAIVTRSWWWLLALPLGLLLRVGKSIWLRRETLTFWGLLNPLRWAQVLVITLVIDIATFVGWIQAGRAAASTVPVKSGAD